MNAKLALTTLARRAGVVLTRTRNTDPWHTASCLLRDRPHPVIFDVGANIGQTARHCSTVLAAPRVYSFEPSPTAYRQLQAAVSALRNVETFNAGMADRPGTLTLLENENSDMSSLLPPGPAAWGQVVRETPVEVWTVDGFREERDIARIDVLKTDTQGADLAVLRGAQETIAAGGVDLILVELTFCPMYDGAPRFDELLRYVLDRGFRLVGLYVPTRQHGFAIGWGDALLAHQRLLDEPTISDLPGLAPWLAVNRDPS
jgi:FkbM family methyltransferase